MTIRPKQLGIMKAKPVTPQLISALGSHCLAQYKYRGQRCRVSWIIDIHAENPEETKFPALISSYGNPFYFLEHIQQELLSLPELPYDGELYVHDWSQQETNSVLNRTENPHPKTGEVTYQIFDIVAPIAQVDRVRILEKLAEYTAKLDRVHIAPTFRIETAQWQFFASEAVALGYEGAILRKLTGVYSPLSLSEPAKRPSCILKFKPTEFDEYEIIDVVEGEGWAKGMLGAFVVASPDGTGVFSVGTGPELTKAKRRAYWLIRDTLPGRILRVKHEPIRTDNGIPICAVAYELV